MSISGVGGSGGVYGASSPQDPELKELAKRYADVVRDIKSGFYLPSEKFNALVKDTEMYIKDHPGMNPDLKSDLINLKDLLPKYSYDEKNDNPSWNIDYATIMKCINHLNNA